MVLYPGKILSLLLASLGPLGPKEQEGAHGDGGGLVPPDDDQEDGHDAEYRDDDGGD